MADVSGKFDVFQPFLEAVVEGRDGYCTQKVRVPLEAGKQRDLLRCLAGGNNAVLEAISLGRLLLAFADDPENIVGYEDAVVELVYLRHVEPGVFAAQVLADAVVAEVDNFADPAPYSDLNEPDILNAKIIGISGCEELHVCWRDEVLEYVIAQRPGPF